MSKFKDLKASLPTDDESVDAAFMRRRIKGPVEQIKDTLTSPDTVMYIMVGLGLLMLIVPLTFILSVPLAMAYYMWASRQKYRLPFKTPINWGGTDYGSPKPGRPGQFADASGILYFGQDEQSTEELWIENGDARRHGFFIGTTGSGKALPMNALILTPNGWMRNEDIMPGEIVCHPDGGTSKVTSIHRQGSIPAVRLHLADGRTADCSLDHLWHIRSRARPGSKAPVDIPEEGRIMQADDLGILHGLYRDGMEICIPYPKAHTGIACENGELSFEDAVQAGRDGITSLDYMPSVYGTPAERRRFLADYIRAAAPMAYVTDHGLRICSLRRDDAIHLKRVVWSLGGTAMTFIRDKDMLDMQFMMDEMNEFHPDAIHCKWPNDLGLEITEVERLDDNAEMSCIKVDREDGLYVMENHITTHNTELLLGVVSQTLMWSSGFLFIDGKGTTEFYARSWTLCKRFGREDDLRVLNFTDPGDDPDAPAGGPTTQSNTLNPFSKGSPDQLMNIVVSLMGDAGGGGDMWKNRATSLVTALMMALCELRDNGEILLNVQTIRDFLFLGKGFDKQTMKSKTGGRKIEKLEDVPDVAWEEMRNRAGLIELYLRALNGELSNSTKLALKAFFDTLPGFAIEKAINGDPQDGKANEQYGFLSMQLTKPLGTLADGYGHIFRTPLGEIDMDDVVLNRRILVVLLPALQKAPEEMQNCGKIVVTLAKIMMGNASGFLLQGTRQEIVEAKQTRSPSPFIVVLDEAGYYMVKGIDTMMAQARSLGFMIIVAGQDMAAMQAIDAQIAETAAANASILAVGKTVDGNKTVQFVQQLMGKATVSVSGGYSAKAGVINQRWDDRMDASFQEVDKVKIEELQNMSEGQFYFLFNGKLVRAATFYIGDEFAQNFSVNKFLKVRGPTDKVPGLDQSVEEEFFAGFFGAAKTLNSGEDIEDLVDVPSDSLTKVVRIQKMAAEHAKGKPKGAKLHASWVSALMAIHGQNTAPVESDKDIEMEIDEIKDENPWKVAEDDQAMKANEGPDTSDLNALLAGALDAGSEHEMKSKLPRDAARRRAMTVDAIDEAEMRNVSKRPRVSPGNSNETWQTAAGKRPPAMNKDEPVGDQPISKAIQDSVLAETTADRYAGILSTLMHEKKIAEKARENNVAIDIEAPEVTDTKTLGQVFNRMAEQMTRMERLLVREIADGNVGAEILGRACSINPMALPGEDAEAYIASRVEGLESAFAKKK
jgi:hypothetical protein